MGADGEAGGARPAGVILRFSDHGSDATTFVRAWKLSAIGFGAVSHGFVLGRAEAGFDGSL
jgi:hypothetical protein